MNPRRLIWLLTMVAILSAACGGDDTDETSTRAAAVEGADAAETIRPGRANWSTGYFQAAIYSALLEELGFTVASPAEHEYPPPEAYVAMAEGTFDFWANGWYSQHYTWHDQELADGSIAGEHLVVLGHQIPSGALEGLVVTKSVADAHGITSLEQVNDDPRLVALFDTDGDGLGEIRGCPEDWTCDDIIDELIAFNEWTNLEQVQAEYPGLVASSIAAVEADEPVIQYTWSPSGYLLHLVPGANVAWLSLGDRGNVLDGSTPGGYDFADAAPAPLGDRCTDDPCWLGWEPADIQVTANRSFAESNAVAVALFEAVELSLADIAAQNVRFDAGESTEMDIERHAAEWIDEHRELVDRWLAVARDAA